MELYKNDKEFILHEKLKVRITRNDFDELGSILEIEYSFTFPNTNSTNLNNTKNIHVPQNNPINLIIMSFYDYNQVQLAQSQLVLLSNHESIFFDNILIINTNSTKNIGLKFLNKEIYYAKIYTSRNELNIKKNSLGLNLNNTYLFDVFHLELLDTKNKLDMKHKLSYLSNNTNINPEKNEHINLIIQEMNEVNLSLIKEKEMIEKSKIQLKNKEENINSMIINFKKEILIHSDKFFNESSSKFNFKLNEIQKKLQATENNIMNKCKIVKEKIQSSAVGNSQKKNITQEGLNIFKEKLANLEIKNKLFEDNINVLKNKLSDKDEVLKNYLDNEEKLNKTIKKIKDENLSYQVKIKGMLEERDKVNLVNNQENKEGNSADKNFEKSSDKSCEKNITNKTNKKKKNTNTTSNNYITFSTPITNNNSNNKPQIIKNKFEINKMIVTQFSEFFILEFLIGNMNNNSRVNFDNHQNNQSLSEKESSICSYLLMHMLVNPIHLFQKFPFSIVFLVRKLCHTSINNKLNKNLIIKDMIDLLNAFNELKKNIFYQDHIIIEATSARSKYKPIIELKNIISSSDNINNNANASSPNFNLIKKVSYFQNYMNKNEKKYLEKNNYALFKIIQVSNLILNIIFTNDIDELMINLKHILEKIIFEKDFFSINYLINLNYFELLIVCMMNLISQQEEDNDRQTLDSLFNIFLDSFLFVYSLDECYNILLYRKYIADMICENKNFMDIINNNILNGNNKVIIFAGILSVYITKKIKFNTERDKNNKGQKYDGSNESNEIILTNLQRII